MDLIFASGTVGVSNKHDFTLEPKFLLFYLHKQNGKIVSFLTILTSGSILVFGHLARDLVVDGFDFGGGAGSTTHISPNFVLVQNGFFGSNAAFFTPQNLSE